MHHGNRLFIQRASGYHFAVWSKTSSALTFQVVPRKHRMALRVPIAPRNLQMACTFPIVPRRLRMALRFPGSQDPSPSDHAPDAEEADH